LERGATFGDRTFGDPTFGDEIKFKKNLKIFLKQVYNAWSDMNNSDVRDSRSRFPSREISRVF